MGVVDLSCGAAGWPVWERSVGFKQPVSGWEEAFEALRYRVEADPPRFPVEEVRLVLSGFTGGSATQLALLGDARGDRLGRVVEADRRLRSVRKGGVGLYRIAGVAPWHPVPEMRYFQTPVDPSAADAVRPLLVPEPVDVRESSKGEPQALRAGR